MPLQTVVIPEYDRYVPRYFSVRILKQMYILDFFEVLNLIIIIRS